MENLTQMVTPMLIATLPPVHRTELLEKIISHPLVHAVRYNTGMTSAFSPRDTLEILHEKASSSGKPLWIDLKCRQLRIKEWAVPDYGKIVLNHHVSVEGEAEVRFRGGDRARLKFVRGNVIYVDPPPRHAVGAGQAVNIIGDAVEIDGYLTDEDRAYITAARELGLSFFMLSFVETADDLTEFHQAFGTSENSEDKPQLVLKIESPKGVTFAKSMKGTLGNIRLMAARDDLFITTKENCTEMLSSLSIIADTDPDAILASRIFRGLELSGSVEWSDYADLELMSLVGYKNHMLSDEICLKHFDKAMSAWQTCMTDKKTAD